MCESRQASEPEAGRLIWQSLLAFLALAALQFLAGAEMTGGLEHPYASNTAA